MVRCGKEVVCTVQTMSRPTADEDEGIFIGDDCSTLTSAIALLQFTDAACVALQQQEPCGAAARIVGMHRDWRALRCVLLSLCRRIDAFVQPSDAHMRIAAKPSLALAQ